MNINWWRRSHGPFTFLAMVTLHQLQIVLPAPVTLKHGRGSTTLLPGNYIAKAQHGSHPAIYDLWQANAQWVPQGSPVAAVGLTVTHTGGVLIS